MTKYLILILLSLLLSSCSRESYFMFQTQNPKNLRFEKISHYVAVNEIEVPNYLKQDHLSIIKENKVSFLPDKWAESIDTALQKELVSYLLKTLPSYGVLEYPWQKSKKAEAEIKIHINDFIYKNGKIVLSGYYFIKKDNEEYKKVFNFSEISSPSPQQIVENMKKLYKRLEKEIVKNLKVLTAKRED